MCRLYQLFSRAARLETGLGRARPYGQSAAVFAAAVVVHDLFRVGRREIFWRRSDLARPKRYERVLPERPAANLGWLVRTPASALVPSNYGVCDSVPGIAGTVDVVVAAPRANCLFLLRDT